MATSDRSNGAYNLDDDDQICKWIKRVKANVFYDLDPRLSGSKQPYQRDERDQFKTIGSPGEQRVGSGISGTVTNDVSDQVQAYASNAIGVSGAMRNKLQKLRHPSSNRRPPPANTMMDSSMGAALNSSTSVHTANFD